MPQGEVIDHYFGLPSIASHTMERCAARPCVRACVCVCAYGCARAVRAQLHVACAAGASDAAPCVYARLRARVLTPPCVCAHVRVRACAHARMPAQLRDGWAVGDSDAALRMCARACARGARARAGTRRRCCGRR